MKKLLCIFIFFQAIGCIGQTTKNYLDLGLEELKSGNFAKAIEYFDALIRQEPKKIIVT